MDSGWTRGLFLATVALAAAGCATTAGTDPEAGGLQARETLFAWPGTEAEAEKAGADEDDKDEAKEEPRDTIVTDRPDFTEASTTVGKGRVQLEAGYTYFRDQQGADRFTAHSYPEALLRVGLFADWFEARLGQNHGTQRALTAGIEDRASGFEDLYVGAKFALTKQQAYLPESALILQATVPTGSREVTADRVLPGFNYLYGWDVVEDLLTAAGSSQMNRARTDTGNSYVEFAQSFTVGYTLTDRLSAYTEWFAFFPSEANDPGVGPEHYFNGGFTYLLTDDFQLDIRAGTGLNGRAVDFFAGAGFAVRY